MWFDPHAALKQLGGGDVPPPDPVPRVAQVARVARPDLSNPTEAQFSTPIKEEGCQLRGFLCAIKRARPTQLKPLPDSDTYLAALHLHGSMTYGAAAVALGWGATRAWEAEAALVADGRATMTREGRTSPNTS